MPGLDDFTTRPVEFPTPPSVTVYDIGSDEYVVEFRWKPDSPVSNPSVVGSFNHWNRADLPMEGPDEDGVYRVMARIGTGDHPYKFTEGADTWLPDPGNPDREPDGHGGNNTILRLGITAIIRDSVAAPDDGVTETRAIRHAPGEYTYFDLVSSRDVVIRARALRNDLRGMNLVLVAQDNRERALDMTWAAADQIFDYFEFHLYLSEFADLRPVAYRFEALDGDATQRVLDVYPLILDPARVVTTPEWARDAIWYQIMVDRFRDGDPRNNPEHLDDPTRSPVTHPWTSEWYTEQPWERDEATGRTFWRWAMYERMYGGDFQGVIDKLDYLQDLGVTAIYLNPVFEAHNSHKYNARSYVHADDGYGVAGEWRRSLEITDDKDSSTWEFNASDEMLLEMIAEIKKRGMKVIFDGVFNHVGDDHPAFLDVRENLQESRFADWFHILSWEPFEYSGWGGFGGLPEFAKTDTDLASESLKEHIWEVTRRWMAPNGDPSAGIDGWRLDVPMHLPVPFWQEWRDLVKSINPDAYISGEIWDPAEEWLDGTTFDAVMNYQLPKAAFPWFSNVERKITASEFDRRLARLRIRYPRNATYVLQNLFDSHDTDRWVSRIANPDLDYDASNRLQDSGPNYFDERPDPVHYQRLKLMALFQMTYIGAPMIWYGTEVGMFGADDPRCRMPMWWEDLGPYESEDYWIDHGLRETFRGLFHLRHEREVLRRGDYRTALADDEKDVFAYYRYSPEHAETVLVVLNNSPHEQTVDIPAPGSRIVPGGFAREGTVLWPPDGAVGQEAADGTLRVTLPAISGAAIQFAR